MSEIQVENDQVLLIINKLCTKFGEIAVKLDEVRSKHKILDETAEEAKQTEKLKIENISTSLEQVLINIQQKEKILKLPQNLRVVSPFLNSQHHGTDSTNEELDTSKNQRNLQPMMNALLGQLATLPLPNDD